MAAHAAAKLLPDGPAAVLVVFPTLGLLEQTYRTWRREAPFVFDALAVCSAHLRDTEDIRSGELSIASTTSPHKLIEWRHEVSGVGVVFCTYQSLPVIAAAHAEGMAAWEVTVFDEAHRTAGLKGKPFAAALDDRLIPAAHRLFFTATPKVHSGPRTRGGKPRRRSVASMDDPELYGRQVFTLPTRAAIEQGILSPFKVAVIAVADSAVSSALKDLRMISLAAGENGAARADHVASSIALTQAAADYGLSSVLAFHNTIAASSEFAATFRRTHALLTARGLVRDGRAAKVIHIDGSTKLSDRLAATQTLAIHDPARWNMVTNARCLTEGINIPALDAVFFAEPRSSEVDVAQAVGRAIRKNPNHDRPALIVLAVTVDDSQDAETVIDISEFKRVRQVLAALQSHDPTLNRDLGLVRQRLADGPSADDVTDIETDILDIHLPAKLPKKLAAQFFSAFSVHTVDSLTRQWDQHYQAARAFAAEHGHSNVPRRHLAPSGADLGTWIQHQRTRYSQGRLLAHRVELLESLPGWAWNQHEAIWNQRFNALTDFIKAHGHPYPDYKYRTPAGDALGIWVQNQRAAYKLGRMPARRVELFESLPGWTWDPLTDQQWEANFAALVQYGAEHGHTRPPAAYRVGDFAVGNWVGMQRRLHNNGKLPAARARRLAGLPGWSWKALDDQWDINFGDLAVYAAQHGHARPPQAYYAESGLALGHWVSDQRRRRAKLSDERRARLESLPGWAWNPAEAQWEENLAALTAFAVEHGHAYPPRDTGDPRLFKLNSWVVTLRRPGRRDRMDPQRRKQLEAVPGWSWDLRQASTWDDSFAALAAFAAEHGHADPPADYHSPDGINVSDWVRQMRRPSRRRKLHPRRRDQLEALPGWHWGIAETGPALGANSSGLAAGSSVESEDEGHGLLDVAHRGSVERSEVAQ